MEMVADIPVVCLGFTGIKNLPGMDPDKSSVVLKPVAMEAASCFPSSLEGTVSPLVGHFCGLAWGVSLGLEPAPLSTNYFVST